MGFYLSKLSDLMELYNSDKDLTILMVGLNSSGKTTALNKLGETQTTLQTIGFEVETVDFGNLHFNVLDIGGQDKIRHLWRPYFRNCAGIVYVVDSNDISRIEEAEEELSKILSDQMLWGVPLLVLANKQDFPKAVPLSSLTSKLCLDTISNRKWFIQKTCATTGEGLYEGFDWLGRCISMNSWSV